MITKRPESNNGWADFWRYQIGVNAIPADTRNKIPTENWKQYQSGPILEAQHNKWKQENAFKDGMAIIAGKVWHNAAKKNLYLILVDLDNQKAIDEFCTRNGVMTPLSELAKSSIVEQHKDQPDKAHIIFYATHPFSKKSSDGWISTSSVKLDTNKVPAIEVKGAGEHGLLFCTPSPHKNGYDYNIIEGGTLEPLTVDGLETHINNICSKYDIRYLNDNGNGSGKSLTPIGELFKPETKILEGHNRHEGLLRVIESMLRRNSAVAPLETIRKWSWDENLRLCVPPLDEREFDKQWRDAVKFIQRHMQTEQETGKRTNQSGQQYSGVQEKYPELIGNAYYQINEKPEKYIIAYKEKNQLIETTAKSKEKDVDGMQMIVHYLVHNKTYLTCIPLRIVRHKNPLVFLDSAAKYTMSFVDAAGEHYTLSHKTLSEILSGLRDLGYVLADGAEGALGAMVQAYKETKGIEDNEDMDYLGFFTNKDNNIIASNIEIKEPNLNDLDDALKFLEELAPYFETRLDLLSTSIVWGIIAPAVFMLKTNNYFLKWLHFYGFPNATKSNTGKIILAIDGHHDDPDFLLNISRIDTIARLGDILSHSTFPKLVDEVDLNGTDKIWLVNSIKSAIEGKIARSKFLSNRATSSTPIPALSPLILTSNPPPPFYDSGYMRRVIERNFPKSETHKETDLVAVQFKEVLRTNLKRLKALGDFRNWFIMKQQQYILDEARPAPLDLGFKILSEAYKAADREGMMPNWLKLRLPENQLEESIEDNSVIVKRAFEKYIDENINHALSFWSQNDSEKDFKIESFSTVSFRLRRLADSNLLPDIKLTKNGEIIIRKGILVELYKYGVTRDQLPTLKSLADYMNVNYRKSDGNKVVACTETQLYDYFDKIEVLEDC